jgi:hypothetical protein
MRILPLATLILGTLGAFAALPAAEPPRPLTPTEVTWQKSKAFLGEVPGQFRKQAGVQIEVVPGLLKTGFQANFDKTPFWEALQAAADRTGSRLALSAGGRKVELVPRGKSRDVAATSGSFRVVAQQVVGRALLDQGITYHEVHLLVHWEPRLRVYRIDSIPHNGKATDVPGSTITIEGGSTQILPLDATSEMKVKLFGLTRDSEKIKTLSGVFTVTAADKMLAFTFAEPGKFPAAGVLPAEDKNAGVSATLRRVQKKDDTWEVEVEVTYPPGQPTFESFQGEWWLRDNRLVVHSPQGKTFVIDDYEIPSPDNPRPLRAVYRFKENPQTGLGNPTQPKWSIVYEAPSPLADAKVPFELKDIPLP